MWAFWVAAALAAIGAVAPLSFSIGAHSRLQWVIVPFGIAAVVLGINAVMYHQGRSLAAALYFFAGLAIVYGILAMVAVPLRLAVVGTCPPAPARCPLGYEQPLTSAENSGLALASFCGILAIFVGIYGLLMLYRRLGVRPRQRSPRSSLQPKNPKSCRHRPRPRNRLHPPDGRSYTSRTPWISLCPKSRRCSDAPRAISSPRSVLRRSCASSWKERTHTIRRCGPRLPRSVGPRSASLSNMAESALSST